MIIYKLTSPVGKCYIGQTANTLEARFKQHVNLANNPKYNPTKLYKALLKYPDLSKWNTEVICECSSKEEMNEKEMYYIEYYNSIEEGYNITKGGDGRKVDFLTEEHKENISEARKKYWETDKGKEWKAELSEKFKTDNICKPGNIPWNKGIKNPEHGDKIRGRSFMTDTGKKKMSEQTKKMWEDGVFDNRPKPTDETRKRISEARLGKKQPETQKIKVAKALAKTWEITYPDGKVEIIISLSKFCKENELNSGSMVYVSQGKAKQHKGFKCKLIE